MVQSVVIPHRYQHIARTHFQAFTLNSFLLHELEVFLHLPLSVREFTFIGFFRDHKDNEKHARKYNPGNRGHLLGEEVDNGS